jgi:hypothetical protein
LIQRAGLVEELRVDVMLVLLGDGLRLFERVEEASIRLEKIHVKRSARGHPRLPRREVDLASQPIA